MQEVEPDGGALERDEVITGANCPMISICPQENTFEYLKQEGVFSVPISCKKVQFYMKIHV